MEKKKGKKYGGQQQKSQVKPRRYATKEAEELYRKSLKKNGFDGQIPNLKAAWNAFCQMSECGFECSEDGLLLEAGSYDFDGEGLYCLSLVRQFTIEVDGEYDYMEQLHLDFTYQADEELKALKETLWTYDFDDDFKKFLDAAEKSRIFRLLKEKYTPAGFEIYLEEV